MACKCCKINFLIFTIFSIGDLRVLRVVKNPKYKFSFFWKPSHGSWRLQTNAFSHLSGQLWLELCFRTTSGLCTDLQSVTLICDWSKPGPLQPLITMPYITVRENKAKWWITVQGLNYNEVGFTLESNNHGTMNLENRITQSLLPSKWGGSSTIFIAFLVLKKFKLYRTWAWVHLFSEQSCFWERLCDYPFGNS